LVFNEKSIFTSGLTWFPLSTFPYLGDPSLSGVISIACCFKCPWEACFLRRWISAWQLYLAVLSLLPQQASTLRFLSPRQDPLRFRFVGLPSVRVKKNRLNFSKFGENRQNRAGLNFKTVKNTFTVSKLKKKEKNQKKCKKTRSNSKVTSEEIFVKPSRLDW
jgi:hypothetical protein